MELLRFFALGLSFYLSNFALVRRLWFGNNFGILRDLAVPGFLTFRKWSRFTSACVCFCRHDSSSISS